MILMQDRRFHPKNLRFPYYASVIFILQLPQPLELWYKNAIFGVWKPQKHYSYVLIVGGGRGRSLPK